jgi:hypothetical protein
LNIQDSGVIVSKSGEFGSANHITIANRRMIYSQGQFWDVLYYGITIEEWREKYA